jgi:glycosyltransferase involved in cell wall biosynthesis
VDNAVEPDVFHYRPDVLPQTGVFFTIAGWRSPKRPDLLMNAMARMREQGLAPRLRVAGVGPKMQAMREQVTSLGLEAQVEFLGQLNAQAVADEMRHAHALVHSSDYETYSAVCAEALCCGTPVIASAVGGVPSLVLEDRGVLVPENTVEAWTRVWTKAWNEVLRMDRARFAQATIGRVNASSVGRRYFQVLTDVLADQDNAPKG